ncbi:MAG: FxsA family protein [Marmoricola sp.]
MTDRDVTARRRFPWWLLVVAFIVVPLVEIYVIIQIGQVIGAWWTIALLIADSILGSWLVKREGARAWSALRVALEQGRMPTRELADGMLILVGGILMLTPGFVLDIVGILCILPVTRPLGRRLLTGVISRRLIGVGFPGTPTGPGTRQRPGPVPDNGVVQGEVVDDGPTDGDRRPY